MRAKLITVAISSLGLGGGLVIPLFPNLLWLGYTLIGIGIITLILGLCWKYVVACAKWLKSKTTLILRIIIRRKEADKYLTINDEQRKNPEKWLYPVIEYVDLNRQGLGAKDGDVFVKFQIDSHLLFPIEEFDVFVKLCLAPDTIQRNDSNWYEIKETEHLAPIGHLERYGLSDKVHLVGETHEEKVLLEWMEDFRKESKPLLAMLKIGMAFKEEDKKNPTLLEGSHWIAPMNNYRGG